jgi:cadmium resistance protein CadD (predicted permease)
MDPECDNRLVTHLLSLISQAVGLFISTDLDDVLVLVSFFADSRFRIREIVAGQYIGIAVIYCVGVVGSWVSFIVDPAFVGLIGLVPIAMGLKGGWELWRSGPNAEVPNLRIPAGRTKIAAVAVVTVANGADNISVYVPLFGLHSGPDIAMVGIVFGFMTALWLTLAYSLTRHRAIGIPVRRLARQAMPFVFVALGVLILYQAGSVILLRRLHLLP